MKTKNVPKVLKCTINHTFFSSQTWGSQTSPTYPFVFNCVTLWHCCAHVWTEQNSEFCGWCCPHIVKKKSSCVCNIIQSFRNLIGNGLWGVEESSDGLVGNYTRDHSSETTTIVSVTNVLIWRPRQHCGQLYSSKPKWSILPFTKSISSQLWINCSREISILGDIWVRCSLATAKYSIGRCILYGSITLSWGQ